MKKLITVLFLLFFYIILGLQIRLFINPHNLIFWTTLSWFILGLFWFSVGDKFLLYKLNARPFKDNLKVRNIVDNNSCRYGNGSVSIFFSSKSPGNIYVCQSMFGSPSIIIGKRVLKILSNNELNLLINLISEKIKSGYIKTHTNGLLSYLLLLSTPLFFEKVISTVVSITLNIMGFKTFTFLRQFLEIFLIPLVYLKNKHFNSIFSVKYRGANIVDESLLKKISIQKARRENQQLLSVVDNLSLYQQKEDDLFNVFLS